MWQATPTTVVHVGYARLFTPPPFQEGPPLNVILLNNYNNTGLTTSGFTPSTINSPVQVERASLIDFGAIQTLSGGLKLGADFYYKYATNGVDFGQFGAPIITIPFNYGFVINRGVELTATYQSANLSYYGNLALAQQRAKGISSAQYNFSLSDLAAIDSTSIPTDHSQLATGSAGVSYLWGNTRFSADMLGGTGTRTTLPGGTPNGASLAPYVQVNLSIQQQFKLPYVGDFKARFDLINLFNAIYLLRSSTSIGAFTPAYGPGRTFFAGLTKEF